MKKTISIVLCLVLMVMSLAFAVSAEENSFYLVLGDSIGYGSGIKNSEEACYGKIIADTNGFDYTNYAVPGHTTTNLLSVLKKEEVIADVKKADIISISIGGNDFLMSNLTNLMFEAIVLDDYSRFDEIGEGFYNNFCEIISVINSYNDSALILMQTLYNPQSGHLRAPYQQGADRINAAIYRYNEENPGEIIIVDVATALGDDMENYASDSVHPSKKGNEAIAKTIQQKLCELSVASFSELVIADEGQDITDKTFAAIISFYGEVFHILSVIYGVFYSFLSRIPVPYPIA